MNRNRLTPFSLSSFDKECVEDWVARVMTQPFTCGSGLCFMALLGLGKGRYAQLLTPAYVPDGAERVFACVYGVRKDGGVQFFSDGRGLDRPFGLSRESPSLFVSARAFYDEGGNALQGMPLSLLVPVLKQIALRQPLVRNEALPVNEIEGVVPLSALPQPTRTGSTRFYVRPGCLHHDGS